MARVVSKRHRSRAVKPLRWRKEPREKKLLPSWLPYLTAISLILMLCLTINYRAYSELAKETREYEELNKKIQNATSENLSMQEEIHYLKTDPTTIEREARKYGLSRKKEKVSRAGETGKAEKSASRQLPTQN